MPCPRDPSRTDITGRAYAGSQRQIQTYVNERTAELSRAVADALQPNKLVALAIRWVSPLAADKYSEYRDAEFLGILGAGHLAPKLREFWPPRGPCWDAVARLDGGGCVIAEAKSHISEVYGNGCAASGRSLSLIKSSIARTKECLGVRTDADWLGRLYQSANRLAYLHFLREIAGIDAFLVNVYFTGDPHSATTRKDWDDGIRLFNDQLGLANRVPYSGSAFLQAAR